MIQIEVKFFCINPFHVAVQLGATLFWFYKVCLEIPIDLENISVLFIVLQCHKYRNQKIKTELIAICTNLLWKGLT